MTPSDLLPIANHLWQSTLFAGVAGILSLLLKKNRAHARYCIWLAASAKFLLPFSLLVLVGSQFQRHTLVAPVPSRIPIIVEQVNEPFVGEVSLSAMPASHQQFATLLVPILVAVWSIGFGVLTFSWWFRWRRVQDALRKASPLPLAIGVPVLCSASLIEPGIFGLFHPVLLLPDGIAAKLAPAELQTILAHELCHARRRDNLTSALHMVVEAVFWFHPLVWWLGARLVEERERACDEEVLRAGNDAQTYAEGILKVCEFYLASPLECVAGVGGSNLKRRIEEIMTSRMTQKLSAGKKALLVSAGFLAVAGPIAIGVTAPQLRGQSKTTSTFEVTSVKPYKTGYPIAKGNPDLHGPEFLPGGRFTATAPLLMVIAVAYDIPMMGPVSSITGGPAWLTSPESVYDIQATAAKGVIPDGLSASARADRMKVMLQALLADRFKLVLRRETKEVPMYALVVGKDGPKIPKADIEEKDCPDIPLSAPATSEACHRFTGGRGRGLHARAVDMSDLVTFVQAWTDRPLVDKTGLKGLYHFETEPWRPMEVDSTRTTQDGNYVGDLPTLFTIFERLGLKMVPQKGNVDVYVIDRIEKPAEN